MRVAIVRGPYLNKPEMQSFEPLMDDPRFSLCAVASSGAGTGDGLRIPLVRLGSPESSSYAVGKPVGDFVELALRGLGYSHYMFELGAVLGMADIVHTVEAIPAFSLQCARHCERKRKPLVVTHWENIPFNFEERIGVRRVRRAVKRVATLFLVPAKPSRAALLLEGVDDNRIELLRPGVNLDMFAPRTEPMPASRPLGISAETRLVLFAGRLEWEKGILDLLDAFQSVLARLEPKPFLLVVGDGRRRDEVVRISESSSLRGHCKVVARVPYHEMPSVYRAADVVVVPSKSIPHWQEQFGMVVAEAMASGLPVIGSDSGAIPEVLGSAGVVVRAGSVPALTEALDSLLADDAARRRMGAAARRRAVETLDARKAARSLASAYLRVAA